jgi:hypothetical protein
MHSASDTASAFVGMIVVALVVGCAPAPTTPSRPQASAGSSPPSRTGSAADAGAAAHAPADLKDFRALMEDRHGVDLQTHMTGSDVAAAIDEDSFATECANLLARAQWRQDILEVTNPVAHFDNCQIEASVNYLRDAFAKAESAASSGDVPSALSNLGRVLHSVFDFYAHTNFVELAAQISSSLSEVSRPALWDAKADALALWKGKGLKSGTVFWEGGDLCKQPAESHTELNKDSPSSHRGAMVVAQWQLTHYRAAADLSKGTGLELVRNTLKRPAWAPVTKKCGTLYGFSLTFDKRKD